MLSYAHKGYDYQDLLVALRLVDVLLGRIESMSVDQKLFSGDLFDDLTTVERTNERERVQFKYSGSSPPLTLSTFTSRHRDLRLDAVFEAALKDLRDFGQQSQSTYRIVLTDKAPTSHQLLAALEDRTGELPAYVKGFESQRFTLKSNVLWPKDSRPSLGALRNTKLERADIALVCQRIVIETGAPSASFDLSNPGHAESLLLQRLREEVGAGIYPNERRLPLDVAQAFVAFAKAARQGTPVRKDDLATRAQLRRDFGAVSRGNPVDSDVAIARRGALRRLTSVVRKAAQSGGIVLLTGPPGQGKSWLSHGLHQTLRKEGWLVAEHYCYLGEADTDLRERVWSQAVFGSLLARLAEEEPCVLEGQRPRFEASPAALGQAIARAASADSPRKVMLIVDGLDHVDRVAAAYWGPNNRARDLAAELAGMKLPAGAVLVVLSQPGPHLVHLERQSTCVSAPQLTKSEVAALMRKLRTSSRSRRLHEQEKVLSLVVQRSRGNALYVTYLCRQILDRGVATLDVVSMLRTIPEFDGTLRAYYDYITRSSSDAKYLTGLLGALPFSATRQELFDLLEVFSRMQLDGALAALSPVLAEREAQGGVRIYHESFARYLAEQLSAETGGEEAMARWLRRVAGWLSQRGFYECPRSFRFLLPTLVRLERFQEVLDRVGVDFVALSIGAGFMPAAIHANLSTAVGVAVRVGEWPAVVRCVELSRAASTFEEDRLAYTWAEHAEVGLAMLGDERFVSSLLFDGRCTVPGRAGILLCAVADKHGLTPPWREYFSLLQHQEETSNVAYGEEADRQVLLARFRGSLRLHGIPGKHLGLWKKLLRPDELLGVVADVEGYDVANNLAVRAGDGDYLLAMAELQRGRAFERACELAKQAAALGISKGELHRLIPFDALPAHSLRSAEADNLVRLTALVQGRDVRFEQHHLREWLDEVSTTCGHEPRSAAAIEALISEGGWYPCWLRFMVRLAAAETQARASASVDMLEVLRVLEADLNPLAGPLRTMDLYGLRVAILPSFGRALSLVKDAEWSPAVEMLSRVSHATTMSFRGEQGGPLTPDDLFELVNQFTTPSRCAKSIALIEDLLREGPKRCYYSFLAGQYMRAARLALKGGANDRAKALWVDACTFSVGYGFRKDTTLWEILDSIPELDKLDRYEARKRLAIVQPLCTRVLRRTDGRETHAARGSWWRLLATSDPFGLAICAVPELFRQTNEAQEVLEGAIDDLWAANAANADVIIAAAARLGTSCAIHRNDVHLARSLVDMFSDGRTRLELKEDLARLCLARIDEHPLEHAGGPDHDSDRTSAVLLAEINALTSGRDVPEVACALPAAAPSAREGVSVAKRQLSMRIGDALVHCFGRGIEGIASAIEHYTSLGRAVPRVPQDVNRFANIVGYRLLTLIEESKDDEAEGVLRSIADSGWFSGGSELLMALGEGLEREGCTNLAVAAYASAWVCARGDGGWTGFGGKGGLRGLVRAFELSKEKATEIVAAKVQEIIAEGDYRSIGVSKAIVRAVASVPSLRHQAFDTWDQCHAVISRRLPLVEGEVDSGPFYRPLDEGKDGESIDQALMFAAVASLAHPGVERKRRGLLAFELLLSARPQQMSSVTCAILREISDPSTLTWSLSVLFRHENRAVVVPDCVAALQELATGSFLIVRALARRILRETGHTCRPPPVSEPDAELLVGDVIEGPAVARQDSVEIAIREQVGDRLAKAESIAPGIAKAVSRRVHRTAASAAFKERLDGQLEALADRTEGVWPEAFLALEEEIERAVQLAAAGARVAAAARGRLGRDAAEVEDALAFQLWDDPMLAIELEATRMNRPPIAPPLTAAEWEALVHDQSSNVRHAIYVRELCGARAPRLRSGESAGWRIVGSSEARIETVGDKGERRAVSKRTGCIGAAFDLSSREQTEWFRLMPEPRDARQPERNSSLVRSFDSHFRNTGLRLRSPILQLEPTLCARFGLSPSRGFELVDRKGKAITMRTFRTDYTRGDYALARPRAIGAVLLMREDIFGECATQWGDAFSWKESIWWVTRGGD